MHQERTASLNRIVSLEQEIVSLQTNISNDKVMGEQLTVEKEDLTRKESEVKSIIAERNAYLDESNRVVEGIKGQLYNKKLEAQKLDYEKSKIVDYLKQVYNVEFNKEEVGLPQESLEELSLERDKLKKRLDSQTGRLSQAPDQNIDQVNAVVGGPC